MAGLRGFAIAQRDAARRGLRRIVFCHVPKCAGSSVSRAIESGAYSLRQRLLLRSFGLELQPASEAAQAAQVSYQRYIPTLLAYQLASPNVRFAAGHIYCPPDLVRRFADRWSFVTILRDPVDRFISAYTYDTYKSSDWNRNTLDLDAYFEHPDGVYNGRTYLHYFGGHHPDDPADDASLGRCVDVAVDNLDRFSVVGAVERMDAWSAAFDRTFSVSVSIPRTNQSPRREVADKIRGDHALMARIREICAPDIEVYRRVCGG